MADTMLRSPETEQPKRSRGRIVGLIVALILIAAMAVPAVLSILERGPFEAPAEVVETLPEGFATTLPNAAVIQPNVVDNAPPQNPVVAVTTRYSDDPWPVQHPRDVDAPLGEEPTEPTPPESDFPWLSWGLDLAERGYLGEYDFGTASESAVYLYADLLRFAQDEGTSEWIATFDFGQGRYAEFTVEHRVDEDWTRRTLVCGITGRWLPGDTEAPAGGTGDQVCRAAEPGIFTEKLQVGESAALALITQSNDQDWGGLLPLFANNRQIAEALRDGREMPDVVGWLGQIYIPRTDEDQ